jgi:hypothetical protein
MKLCKGYINLAISCTSYSSVKSSNAYPGTLVTQGVMYNAQGEGRLFVLMPPAKNADKYPAPGKKKVL